MKNIFIFIIFFSGSLALAGPSHFGYSQLKELIQAKQISRIDNLLEKLPHSLKTDPLYVYDSHALKLNLVNPETPRIILWNEDASLIMALTKNPGQSLVEAGQDTLEIISYNSLTDQFEMRDLVFNGKETPFQSQEPQKNPALCLSCHGVNPRPIFQNYNTWPGFYGSFSGAGAAVKGSQEFDWLTKFLGNQKQMERYRHLDTTNFRLEKEALVYYGQNSPSHFTPNLVFGQNLERLMLKRIARKIVQHPEFQSIMPVLTYLGSDFTSCGPIRERIKSAYQFLANVKNDRLDVLKQLREKIYAQAKADYEQRDASFLQFNKVSKTYDGRGHIDFVYNLMAGLDDPYYEQDPKAFNNEMVLMEVLLRRMNFNVEDVSTFPRARSLGVFHIREGTLYPDEQYFFGLTSAIAKINPNLLPSTPYNCEDLRQKTSEYLGKISLDSMDGPGILFEP